jgi:hypothetical protein
MFSSIKFTAYEVFAYLFPGMVAFVASFTVWSVFRYAWVVVDLGQPSIVWIIIGVVSYLLGHLVESVASHVYGAYWESIAWVRDGRAPNLAVRVLGHPRISRRRVLVSIRSTWRFIRSVWSRPLVWLKALANLRLTEPNVDPHLGRSNHAVLAAIYHHAETQVRFRLGTRAPHRLSRNWVFEICGSAVRQAQGADDGEKAEMREVWSYREGFYKGMSLSLLMLWEVLMWTLFYKKVNGTIVRIVAENRTLIDWGFRTVLCIAIACFLAAYFYWRSAKKVRGRRVGDTLSSFLLLTTRR